MNQKAHTIKNLFSRETTVSVVINATPEKIWGILTNVQGYKNWNSTLVSIEGEIQAGGQVRLISKLDPKRTFKLSMKTFEPPTKLAWGDMMGARVYLLTQEGDGTLFTMTEKIGGPLFPLFAKMIPSFDESFDAYARDLKVESEK
ncbi:MAG: SRPBCC domain-containing protein [Minisyncoccia bacterium]